MEKKERPTKVVISVDTVPLMVKNGRLRILLVRRPDEPFKGRWSLPGGIVRPEETLEWAAMRHLTVKAHMDLGYYLEQLYTFGDPNRDPRGRTIAVSYLAIRLPEMEDATLPPETASEAKWFTVAKRPPWLSKTGQLAFDHIDIIDTAIRRIRGKLDYTPIGFRFLAARFTLSELQEVHEAILGTPLDKRNFRKKIKPLVKSTGKKTTGVGRPALIYEETATEA